MKLRGRGASCAAAAAVLACAAAVLPAAALAGTGAAGAPSAGTGRPAACTSAHTQTWLGLGDGGGTFVTIFYPVEFTNAGTRACSLTGYPGVTAVDPAGHRVGPAGDHFGPRRPVTLRPGETAHAILGIRIASTVPGCTVVPGASLKVVAPGQVSAAAIPDFTFDACSDKVVLRVDAVHPGTGVPGLSIR